MMLRRLLIAASFLALPAILPATASAQAYLTQWGTHGTGNGQFQFPQGVAVDAGGRVYVADLHNSRIQVFTSSGAYLTQWGTYGVGDGQFQYPQGVAVSAAGDV